MYKLKFKAYKAVFLLSYSLAFRAATVNQNMTHCEVFRALLAVSLATLVCGHGMLLDPPSRNSAWRVGFDTPKNWNDNEQNCGGFATQWNTNNGRCGVCGDPFNAKKQEHIHPGKYATGTVTRTYSRGQTIKVRVRHLKTILIFL